MTAATALAAGEVDWWENPSPDLARLLAANPDLVVEDTDPLGSMGLLRFPGGSAAHSAIAIGQRGWKRQPEAGARALARRQAKSGSYDSDDASQSRPTGLSHITEPSRPDASCPESERGVWLCPGRLCGVEFPVALFDAASPFVSGKDDADVVWASAFACSGDFLLRFAGCQGKDLIPQRRRATLASRFSGCGALAPPSSRWSGSLSFRGRHFG